MRGQLYRRVIKYISSFFFLIKYTGNNKEPEILFAVNMQTCNSKNMLIHRKYFMNMWYPL